jgi:hypothetical protein
MTYLTRDLSAAFLASLGDDGVLGVFVCLIGVESEPERQISKRIVGMEFGCMAGGKQSIVGVDRCQRVTWSVHACFFLLRERRMLYLVMGGRQMVRSIVAVK